MKANISVKKYKESNEIKHIEHFETLFDLLVLYQSTDYPACTAHLKTYIEQWLSYYFEMPNIFKIYPQLKENDFKNWSFLSQSENKNLSILIEPEYMKDFIVCLLMIEKDFPDFVDALCEACINPDNYVNENGDTMYDALSLNKQMPEEAIIYKSNLLFMITWGILERRYPEIYTPEIRPNFQILNCKK